MGDAVGNFKGVMLCNRPAQIQGSLQASVGPMDAPTRPAFVSSVVPDQALGINPVRKQGVPRAEPKPRSDDVTWRHKRWLSDFSDRRKAIVDLMERKVALIEQNKQRFAAKSQAMRDNIRQVQNDNPDDIHALQSAVETAIGSNPHAPKLSDSDLFSSPPAPSQPSVPVHGRRKPKNAKAANNNKPVWALTQQEAEDMEEQEVDDLLNFTDQLNLDKYVNLEVSEAVRFVQNRVNQLHDTQAAEAAAAAAAEQKALDDEEYEYYYEEEEAKEGGGEGADEARKLVRRRRRRRKVYTEPVDHAREWNASTKVQPSGHGPPTPHELAKDVMDSAKTIRAVHSSASVRQMIDKTQRQRPVPVGCGDLAERDGMVYTPSDHHLGVRPPPLIAVTEERERKQLDPSKLPFLYRHPSV